MKKILVLALSLALVFSTCIPASAAHWSDEYYSFLRGKSVLNSDFGDAPEIRKNMPITRGEFFALVVSAFHGKQAQTAQEPRFQDFSEVPQMLSGYIAKAYNQKLLAGVPKGDKYYVLPSQPISRQEAATVLGRMVGLSINLTPSFSDSSDISAYAMDYVCACEKTNLLAGYSSGEFLPKNNITWAEAVKILATALKSNITTPAKITRVAGNAASGAVNGEALSSSLNNPSAITAYSGALYIADTGNNKIRQIQNGKMSDTAGKILGYDLYNLAVNGYRDDKLDKALFASPSDLLPMDGHLLVLDSQNNSLRSIAGSNVCTFAGTGKSGFKDGKRIEALFNRPKGLCKDDKGTIYVADTGNNVIRKIDKDGMVTTFAGQSGKIGLTDGKADEALFNSPSKLAYSKGILYVSDSGNNRIRMIQDGIVSTLAGSGTQTYENTTDLIGDYKDGDALNARFNNPTGIAVGDDGTVYVADTGNSLIRSIYNGKASTLAGLSVAGATGYFVDPVGLYLDNNLLYIADSFKNTVVSIEVSK